MSVRPWLLVVVCACSAPLAAEGEVSYTFRSAEAVDSRLSACPDALVDGLAAGASLARDEAGATEGTLGLLGEVVAVRFHQGDEDEPQGVFPLDFAEVHRAGAVGWYLLEAEQAPGGLEIRLEAEAGRCVLAARFDES